MNTIQSAIQNNAYQTVNYREKCIPESQLYKIMNTRQSSIRKNAYQSAIQNNAYLTVIYIE